MPRQVEILEEGAARPAALLGFIRLVHALAAARPASPPGCSQRSMPQADTPSEQHPDQPEHWEVGGDKGGSLATSLGDQRCSLVVDSGTGTSAVGALVA